MRLVFGLVLVLGIGLAGFAVYMANGYIQSYKAELSKERAQRGPVIELTDLIVAKKPLRYGEQIQREDLRMIKFPAEYLPEGGFTTAEAFFPEDATEPRRALRAIDPNEPVLASKVTEPGKEVGITSQLERGERAFAIRVDVSSGVSGFLRPGDFVDVYWTGSVGRSNRTQNDSTGEVTKLIQSSIRLVAVDQSTDPDMKKTNVARTVTVAVAPQQVAALAQAQSTGRLSLSLVGVRDDTIANIIEVDQRMLLGLAEDVREAPAPEEEICTIRTNRGGEVVETRIPCTN